MGQARGCRVTTKILARYAPLWDRVVSVIVPGSIVFVAMLTWKDHEAIGDIRTDVARLCDRTGLVALNKEAPCLTAHPK